MNFTFYLNKKDSKKYQLLKEKSKFISWCLNKDGLVKEFREWLKLNRG